MKKLKKIKLINWHMFYSDTIEIKDNCLITGENGSGKSTLLDAIQYVLTAGRVKFNQAANDMGKRTVESYIRGKVGYENKEYLRDEVTSYIVLEFFDDEKNESDLLGVVLELTPLSPRLSRLFFKMSKQEIKDDLFITSDKCARPLSQFKRTVKLEATDNSREFQSIICSYLGISGKNRYFELLSKALAFKPINDVNAFVKDFLLSESAISLETLQQNVENFSRLEREIALEEEKIGMLEEIEKSSLNYETTKNSIEKNEYFLRKIEKEKLEKEVRLTLNLIKIKEQDINLKNQESVANQKEVDNLNTTINEYRLSLKENKEYQLYDKWETKLKNLKFEQDDLIPYIKSFTENLNCELENLKDFEWSKSLKRSFTTPIDLNFFEKMFVECIEKKNEVKGDLERKILELDHSKKEIGKIKNDLEEKVKLLEKKERPYNESVIQLITAIKNHFKELNGENIEVRPLCEYLEITAEKWRNAIEGYLNNQKFDLILEPKYFDEALQVYEKYKQEKNIYGVGLVNTQKFNDLEPISDSLASHVTSINTSARRYAMFLLNKVTCCEDVKALKKYSNAITPSCMTYRNNVARQINPKVYNSAYIGKKGLELQLAKTQEQLKNQSEAYNLILNEYNKVMNCLSCLRNSQLDNLQSGIYNFRRFQNIKQEADNCKEKMEKLEVTGFFSNVLDQIKEFENNCSILNSKIKEFNREIATLETNITALKEEINEKEEKINLLKNMDENDEWEKEFIKKVEKTKIQELENKLNLEIHTYKSNLPKLEFAIENFQEEYNKLYQFDQIVGIQNVSSYLNELYNKRKFDLVKRKSQSADFKEACQISFREDFISKLKDKIDDAKRELKELNKALKGNPFGNEQYEFILDKSTNPEMANYYRIITSGNNYQMNTLFENNLSDEDRNTLDDLFVKISASNSDEVTKKILDEYTDYRNYMSYDIKVTKDNGESYSFSKLAKEKSGGEIQTPFYVIIAASFEQLLHTSRRKSSTGCVVMFDEAFNNMDESRIEAMMNFYKRLKVQLLIAVPPEKTYIIDPYVDTTLVIMNNGKGTYMKSIRQGEFEHVETI